MDNLTVDLNLFVQLHTELVCHVVRKHELLPSDDQTGLIQLGNGTIGVMGGTENERIDVALKQLGRSCGLRLAERLLHREPLHPNAQDTHRAIELVAHKVWPAMFGKALAYRFDEQERAYTIIDDEFAFVKHLDFAAGADKDPRHIDRAPSHSVDLPAAPAAEPKNPRGLPRPRDYVAFTEGVISGSLEVLGFGEFTSVTKRVEPPATYGVEVTAWGESPRRAIFRLKFSQHLQ